MYKIVAVRIKIVSLDKRAGALLQILIISRTSYKRGSSEWIIREKKKK